MSLLNVTPAFDPKSVESFVLTNYGLKGVAQVLPSERDQNFLLESGSQRFVVKVSNGNEEPAFLDAVNKVLQHLERRLTLCPRIVATLAREPMTQISSSLRAHYLRVLTFIPGRPLAECERFPVLLTDFGKKLARIDNALADFDHPALHRKFHWDLANGVDVIRKHSSLIRDLNLKSIVQRCCQQFESKVGALLNDLPRTVIHGDANDYNVIVSSDPQALPMIVGLIDFGDMVHSYGVAELAIALAYTMLNSQKPIEAATRVVAGYNSERRLSEVEMETLFVFVKLRLGMSICLAAYQQQQRPDNHYLEISQGAICNLLPELVGMDEDEVLAIFNDAMVSSGYDVE